MTKAIISIAILLATVSASMRAQPVATNRRIPVRVDLDPRATHQDSVRIERTRRGEGQIRIILPAASASPRLLASGVLALVALMEQEGDDVTQSNVAMVGILPYIPADDALAAEQVLLRLKTNGSSAEGERPRLLSTTLWVPNRAERARIRAARLQRQLLPSNSR